MRLLASFKLRFHDVRIRIVPTNDEHGCPFAGPGVDLMGEEARVVLDLCGPLLRWFEAREPGVVVRALSMDLASGRVLVSLEAEERGRPRVLRFDASDGRELVDLAATAIALMGTEALRKLRARDARP